jgi:hypothetical protein
MMDHSVYSAFKFDFKGRYTNTIIIIIIIISMGIG